MNNSNDVKTLSIYIHIPFCIKKCEYCDFYSLSTNQYNKDTIDQSLNAIKQNKLFYLPLVEASPVHTIYFGGGTPSVLDIYHLDKLLLLFPELHHSCENTIEINPETVTEEKLKLIKSHGINRISIGIQTFSQSGLDFLGREVKLCNIYKALEIINKYGFTISCDLMLGIPNSYIEEDLNALLEINPDHISCYMLTLYKNTLLGKRLKTIEYDEIDEKSANDYLKTLYILGNNGFEHYEISNFKRKGTTGSLHNLIYWTRQDYIGLGPSASNFINPYRWKNQYLQEYNSFWNNKNKEYSIKNFFDAKVKYQNVTLFKKRNNSKNRDRNYEIHATNKLYAFLKSIDNNAEYLTLNEAITETIMLFLRLKEGLLCELLKKIFNYDIIKKKEKEIQMLIKNKKLMYKNNTLYIPSEEMLHFNSIIAELI